MSTSHDVVTTEGLDLPALYEADETAWLEAMAKLAAERRLADLDCAHLSEYLSDMAQRDRREVHSRLVLWLTHRLQWDYQPRKRTRSWESTLLTQARELRKLLESGTLRNHANQILAEAYQDARQQAAVETGLPLETFPVEWDRSVDEMI
jgi:hypothetical protein